MSKLAALLSFICGAGYNERLELSDLKYIFDSEVNTCLINLYLCITKDDEKLYEEFSRSYELLNEEQKNYVKNDFINILNTKELQRQKIKN